MRLAVVVARLRTVPLETVRVKVNLPPWLQEWLGVIMPLGQVLLIVLAAWLLARLARHLLRRLDGHYSLPLELNLMARRLLSFVIYSAALLLVLQQLGVSSMVLWTAFTGFATVAAVAFFAAWSVLSNIFCTLLIAMTKPFRLNDHIELLENGEKPGLRGRVIDINLIYTTLQEVHHQHGDTRLQIPNSLFFQRTLRRWPNGVVPPPVEHIPGP